MKNSVFLKGLLKGILIVSLVFSLPIQAANDASERLTNLLMAMQSFQANFKQITLDGRGDTLQEMVGELAVQRPGLVYWKTNPPLEQLVVSDGDRLWLYDPDLEQVTVQKLDPRITQTPALLLSGKVDTLKASYHIRGDQLNKLEVFVLVPKDPESLFEQLKMTFSEGQLVQMHLTDSLGQRSSFEFFDIQTNRKIASELFHFTPPDGVDVIAQ